MKFIDNFLNNITMYRLVLYCLIFMAIVATLLGFAGLLPYSGLSIIGTILIILTICISINYIFSYIFEVPSNFESTPISALILAFIITPVSNPSDIPFVFWASVLTISSKYILAIKNKQLFNPVAIGVLITSIGISRSANWWTGTPVMLLPALLTGFLIVRKIKRFDMVFYFFTAEICSTLFFTIVKGGNISTIFINNITDTAIGFFAFYMLTEPATTPPTKFLQSIYGALTGILFSPQIHIGSIYSTPELALIIGNVFSYLVSSKQKYVLTMKNKYNVAKDTFDFIFIPNDSVNFKPGQYMEWTLGHDKADDRGIRRYFTIASSPTKKFVRIGVKFNEHSSSYKNKLMELGVNDKIIAGGISGDFTLSGNTNEKLVFIAGGIGITPYISMIEYFLDKGMKMDVILFYTNKQKEDIAYKEILDSAENNLGLKTIYVLTDKDNIPLDWKGKTGYIDENMIKSEVPDYQNRKFYLSGPNSMVTSYKDLLLKMGVIKDKVVTDYFPGFA